MKITLINSRGHWRNGWFDSEHALSDVVRILEDASIDVDVVEVSCAADLDALLARLKPDSLIWSNAYLVGDGPNERVWLNDRIEGRGLPLLGSPGSTLRAVLHKDACQLRLAAAGVPTPPHTIFDHSHVETLEDQLRHCGIQRPLVLKPTSESGSVGVALAHTFSEAAQAGRQILDAFPEGRLLVEAFLPSDDITCGFIQLGEDIMLLPTAYRVRSVPGREHILSREQRLRTWDSVDKTMTVVTDEAVVAQLKQHIPTLVRALDIHGVTRVDGRLDSHGVLRFFDVNGFPALSFPDSVMVKQCLACFPDYPPDAVFRALIHTLVYHSALRWGFEPPEAIAADHLFAMSSEAVLLLRA